MCHTKRLLIPAIAVVFLALTLVPATRVADAQASEHFTTLLQPGLNMVGWTHPETGVDALFADIPELEAVYAWDAKAQHFTVAYRDLPDGASGNLTTLIPGMGLWLAVAGSEPVPLDPRCFRRRNRRSRSPARGLDPRRVGGPGWHGR